MRKNFRRWFFFLKRSSAATLGVDLHAQFVVHKSNLWPQQRLYQQNLKKMDINFPNKIIWILFKADLSNTNIYIFHFHKLNITWGICTYLLTKTFANGWSWWNFDNLFFNYEQPWLFIMFMIKKDRNSSDIQHIFRKHTYLKVAKALKMSKSIFRLCFVYSLITSKLDFLWWLW
jgi:hypothetical protein